MKHPIQKRPASTGIQLIQALGTLGFLIGIYAWSLTFNSTNASIRSVPKKPEILTSKYWNESLGYGFQMQIENSYESATSSGADHVIVSSRDGEVYRDDNVRVSFYRDSSIKDIEKKHGKNKARAYSRLPNGIAVIEGNLDGEVAKLVLATLHTR